MKSRLNRKEKRSGRRPMGRPMGRSWEETKGGVSRLEASRSFKYRRRKNEDLRDRGGQGVMLRIEC